MKLQTFLLTCLASMSLHAELFFTPQMIAKHLETYTDEEVRLINKDLDVIRDLCLDGVTNNSPRFYLATAGAPGARKSTILENFIDSHPEYQNAVYVDPDPRTLKYMVNTYYAQSLTPLMISQAKNYDEAIKNAYDKWRSGSNYIALTIFEEVAASGKSLIHGTTSTGAHIPKFYEKVKQVGYKIVLLLCSCPDEVRKKAIEYRNNVVRFYQCSPGDAVAKGIFFPQRMQAYFDNADEIYLYWSDDVDSKERLAAHWDGEELQLHDADAMERFKEKYESDRKLLMAEGKELPEFESYFETH